MAMLISIVLLLNLFFQTFGDEAFQKMGDLSLMGVIKFHIFYPYELIMYLCTIFIPAIYYSFIRGVRFHEHGIIVNRGLPYFNFTILYKDISKYEILQSNHFLSITSMVTEDDYMFTVNDLDRVLAILDQHNINGDLGKSAAGDRAAHKKLALFILIVGVLVSLIQYSGFIRQFFR